MGFQHALEAGINDYIPTSNNIAISDTKNRLSESMAKVLLISFPTSDLNYLTRK